MMAAAEKRRLQKARERRKRLKQQSTSLHRSSPVVTNVHGTKWMGELKSLCDNAERKLASTVSAQPLRAYMPDNRVYETRSSKP
ncbi:hypothetical protein AA0116_g4051 [Alternaria tenuissima]|jgi:hypothetical protein|nr:hypothetical protein AA0116_g4051 [Alternaria tenuissima]